MKLFGYRDIQKNLIIDCFGLNKEDILLKSEIAKSVKNQSSSKDIFYGTIYAQDFIMLELTDELKEELDLYGNSYYKFIESFKITKSTQEESDGYAIF